MKKRTTIYDIAKALNLTPSTVSRGLNNHSFISDATKQLIKEKAIELNYKINAHAYNLRTGGSKTLGVIVPKINLTFFSNIIAGIEEVANLNQHTLIICQSNDDFQKELDCINTLIHQNVACIMMSLAATSPNGEHLAEILQHQIPLIQFDRVSEDVATHKVINNNEIGIIEAVAHLKSRGCTKFAHIAGPQHLNIYKERKDAFIKALQMHDLEVHNDWIILDSYSKEKAKIAVENMLMQTEKPDAIIASADFLTLAVLEAANECNIAIPNQLAVCGYSNEIYTELTKPSISSINQFSLEMGKAVANVYFDSLQHSTDKKTPKTVVIEPQLIIRESTLRAISSS